MSCDDKCSNNKTHEIVSEYYGQTLKESSDLKTNACTTAGSPPFYIKEILKNIHPDVISRYYGCGLCIPHLLEGATVLDLGCGSGRDVYLAAQLVGPKGKVIGVDMTEELLKVARDTQEWHSNKFGYLNTRFLKGYIEKLSELDIQPSSVDVIISNCVINLSPDKNSVFDGCFRLLKPGGEFYFSDVYSNTRVPNSLARDSDLWGECVSGALYEGDFINLVKKSGFLDPRLIESSSISLRNQSMERQIRMVAPWLKFTSATYRLFKLSELESQCEDYGQAVIYKGTIPQSEGEFQLDNHHVFLKGKVFPICGNSWKMLHETRFKDHFIFIGNFVNNNSSCDPDPIY
jgi:arsenite methyltransferase